MAIYSIYSSLVIRSYGSHFDSSHCKSLFNRRFSQTKRIHLDYRYNSSSNYAIATVSFGVSGYSLPWDQVGYWASKIVTSVPEALDN